MKKYTYVWVSLVILVFGIIFVPKIVDRVQGGTVVENDRLNLKDANEKLAHIVMNGKKRRVPPFAFIDQDSLVITNEDYQGKVYLVEFFFTSCPTICPIMTKNFVDLQEEFKTSNDFGVASFTITPNMILQGYLRNMLKSTGLRTWIGIL